MTVSSGSYESLIVDDPAIRVYRQGDSEAPQILYLHSASGEVCSLLFFDKLVRAGYGVIAPELPGFGASTEPSSPWRCLEDAIYHMRRTIQLLSSGPAILVGSSLGGWLAAEVGVWFPELVSALVLIDPVGLRIDGSPIYNIFGTPGTDHQAELMARGNPHGVDTISPLIPAFADTDVPFEVGMMMHFARAMAATARIGWNPYLHDPRLMGRLSSVLAPTLVLWGADDGIVPRTHADAYVEGIPGAILEVIPHSGHTPVLDQPFLAAASVIEFLTAQLGEVGTLDQAPVVTSN